MIVYVVSKPSARRERGMGKNNGGPAFPTEQHECQDNTWNQTFEYGMTLRQWYAGMAMQGLLSNPNALLRGAIPSQELFDDVARWANGYADAMIKFDSQEAKNES
jgi:hypothetical protein